MASYSTRQRDPLLDSTTQAVLEKRGKELLGLGLLVLGVMAGMMIASYSPDDPNWMLASDAPVNNFLGRTGASIAAPLFMIIGMAAWCVSLVFVAWGVRFMAHIGEERLVSRIIIAPIAIALCSVQAATLAPGASWAHSFGLGGLFGDTALSVLLTIMPMSVAVSVKIVALLTAFIAVTAMGYVIGLTRPEVKRLTRFMVVGVILIYALLLKALGRGAQASVRAAQGVQGTIQQRREGAIAARAGDRIAKAMPGDRVPDQAMRRHVAEVVRANPAMPRTAGAMGAVEHKMPPQIRTTGVTASQAPLAAPARDATPEPRAVGGFRSLMPSLLRRQPEAMPEPELVTQRTVAADAAPIDGDRIRQRINDVIRNRSNKPTPAAPITRTEDGLRIEPSLTAGRGPKPLVLTPAADERNFDDDPILLDDETAYVDDFDVTTDDPSFDAPAPAPAPIVSSYTPEPRKVVQHTLRRFVVPSRKALAEEQPRLKFDDAAAAAYEAPPLNLLTNPVEIQRHHLSDEALEENARMLESVLDDYGVKGEIVSVRPGPVVTMYELEPAPGLKASRVIGLSEDIARSMSALSARVSTVPGRSVIGIELPNANREKVVLREILSARDFGDSSMRLPLALGKDIGGDPIVANLAKMPHLLIAGTTGSGKSVAINTMILSLLYRLTPDECRLIMIDPKMLELSVYDGIPHLLSPVVTDPKKAVVALKWVVGEMEERYRRMSKMGVRNIEGFNGRVADAQAKGELFSRTVQTGFDDDTGDPIFETEEFEPEKMPYIVVIVDEMADLMMVAGKEIEACIQRLAQMARASGIHLIMATQRPSVDVITGTIKANFPTRISFQVTSKIDSRTILGEQGAEQLLGMGDMLYMAGGAKITRVHGPFVSDEEVEEIVNHLKGFGPPDYMSGVVDGPDEDRESDIDMVLGLGSGSDSEDALYDTAVAIVIKDRKCSTSYIQRKLSIGYNKAARLVEQMEDEGVVSGANHVGKREILVPEQH